MIDLHTHTTESDGTLTSAELIRTAAEMGLEALGITDHDTFTGWDQAVEPARQAGLELICGIELSTKLRRPGRAGKSVHLLGYFFEGPPDDGFRAFLENMQRRRRERNIKIVARLQGFGFKITLEEVESLGRNQAGRPHFARLMLDRGYVSDLQEAFDVYLGEGARAYIDREEPGVDEGIQWILQSGGLPCLPHPNRLAKAGPASLEPLLVQLRDLGLRGLEVYYSEHTDDDTQTYLDLARRYDLAVTGGSDFHGDNKPGISLGTGVNGNLCVPRSVLDELREVAIRP